MLTTYNPKFNRAYEEIIKKLDLCGIIPLVKISDAKKALPLAGALIGANVQAIEIVFRSSAAPEALKVISQKCTNLIVGAGTIIEPKQVLDAVNAGAQFIITPSFNPSVVDRCIELGIPVFPGCSTPSDIEQAYNKGLRVVNYFPAELNGGVEMLKVLSRPYPFMRFIPTGGINIKNLNDYLSFNKVLCCAGTFLADESELDHSRFDNITRTARDAVDTMIGLKLDHVALLSTEQSPSELQKVFSRFAGQNYNPENKIVSGVEVLSEDKAGAKGYLVYSSPNLERCIYYLKNRNFKVIDNTVKKENNKIVEVTLSGIYNGFGIKLIRSK